MPLSQQVMWTAIPRGWGSGDRLRCSIVISPRLRSTDTALKKLSQYPDWVNWVSTLQQVSLTLVLNGKHLMPGDYTVLTEPQPAVWEAVFQPDTPVQPYQFPMYAQLPISSYPVKPLVEFVQQVYQTFGQNAPDSVPQWPSHRDEKVPSWLDNIYEVLSNLALDDRDQWQKRRRQLRARLQEQKAIAWQRPDLRTTFEWIQYFHEPMNAPMPHNANPTYAAAYSPYKRAVIALPKPDFHEILSALLNHPLLLERLGILIIVEFPRPSGMPATGWVQVQPKWTPAMSATVNLTPQVQYQLDGAKRLFLPQPAPGSDIVEGLVNLQSGRYEFVSVDPDGAARKLLGFASSLRRLREGVQAPFQTKIRLGGPHAVDPESRSVGTPALQSVGFMLVRHNLAFVLFQHLQRAQTKNTTLESTGTETLFAEDLLRGYRIDVWDSITNQWHSLFERLATYKLLRTGDTVTGQDEGTLTLGPVTRTDAPPDEMRLHESLAVWKGWSLAVQRPGKTIDTEDNPADPANDPLDKYQIKATFAVPAGSLPRLRFGKRYRFRLRTVDLAGYSRPLKEIDPNDFSKTSDELVYYRWEPVPNPVLLMRSLPDPDLQTGESLEVMAIRYRAFDPEAPAATTQISERHVVAPRGSVELAEQHGKLDTAPGGKMDPATYAMLVSREDTLPGGSALFPEAQWTNPVTGETVAYPLKSDPQVTTPYIPDPLARAAVFQNVPGLPPGRILWIHPDGSIEERTVVGTKNAVIVNFGEPADWPNVPGFRLVLAEGDGLPSWDQAQRVLTIYLPKGREATLLYSCTLGATPTEAEQNRDLLALWHLLSQGAPPAVAQKLHEASLYGWHWMLTPPRKLTIVHAVSQPLADPVITTIAQTPQRSLGDTKAPLQLDLTIDAKSTGKVTINGEWNTPIDNPAEPEPRDGKDGRDPAPQSGTTVGEIITDNPTQDTLTNLHFVHEFGDTKHRRVRYRATAISRYREFFPPRLSEEFFARSGPEQTLQILNTARPAGLSIPYAIPAFRWQRQRDGNRVISERIPVTRIYIERPWYSSGEDELLAVLLPAAGQPKKWLGGTFTAKLLGGPSLPPQLQPYVTSWGLDPIWLSAPTPTDLTPTPVLFSDVVQTGDQLTLEELKGTNYKVTAVGFEPRYDAERGLWYADIPLDPGESYFPFVRFALARFQPYSVDDAHLSRVTTLDFLQILPRRKATVVQEGKRIRIIVEGHTYRAGFALHANSEMEATVEMLLPDQPPALGWKPLLTIGLDRIESRTPGVWVGNIDLQQLALQPGAKLRVVLKEFEQWFADAPSRSGSPELITAKIIADPMMGTRLTRRLVYADAVSISAE